MREEGNERETGEGGWEGGIEGGGEERRESEREGLRGSIIQTYQLRQSLREGLAFQSAP